MNSRPEKSRMDTIICVKLKKKISRERCEDRVFLQNKTAEDAEGRGESFKQPLRTSAHSAVSNKEDQPQRTQRAQRVVVFLCVLCALCGFPNLIQEDNKSLRNQF